MHSHTSRTHDRALSQSLGRRGPRRHIDSAVGDILAALDETGQRENTLILFSSDNGPWQNDRAGNYPDHIALKNYNQEDPLRGKKLDVWEGGIHVAGFIHWPAKFAAKEISTPVHIIDWFPTLAKIIAFEPANELAWDGIDLSPALLKGGHDTALPDRDLYWIWSNPINRWVIRHGKWKVVAYGKEEPTPPNWQLFDSRRPLRAP